MKKNRKTALSALVVLIILLASIYSINNFIVPWLYLRAQIDSRLSTMKLANSSQIRTDLRGEFDRDYNFTDLYEWVNTQLQFVPLDETMEKRPTDPFEILEYGKGRCGEFSILYVSVCLAHGYEARLVDQGINTLDINDDHMWAEVKLGDRWVHVDPSEKRWNETDMYEAWPWGKDLASKILAFEDGKYEDVTLKYKQGN